MNIKIKKAYPIACFLLFLLLVTYCTQNSKPVVSFYYWKSRLTLNKNETEILNNNGVKRLYIRYFDIKLNEMKQPIPDAILTGEPILSDLGVIPVVYIKNEVFSQCKSSGIDTLATRTIKLIREINTHFQVHPVELQFDCDWTLTTRDAYFQFIRKCKSLYPLPVSATIRLHQVKYKAETGVPPVDHGVLMYYNMGTIDNLSVSSVYDRKIAAKYISYLKNYPLQLDVALPLFSWGIQLREGKVVGLLNKMGTDNFKEDKNFVSLPENRFRAIESGFKGGYYLQKNDVVKIEYVTDEQLLEMADDLKQELKQSPNQLIFYDLDSLNFKYHEQKIFQQIQNSFH